MIKSVFIFLGLTILPPVCFAQDAGISGEDTAGYFAPNNTLKFADFLYTGGDYLRAAGEYRRYLFCERARADTDSIYYKMIKSTYLGGDYRKTVQLLDRFGNEYPLSPITADIGLLKSIVSFKQKDYSASLDAALGHNARDSGLRAAVVAMDYLHLGDYEKARQWACRPYQGRLLAFPGGESSATTLCENIKTAGTLPHKSMAGAALLSALVPGAGKVYCGRVSDGMYSLVVVGLTAWQAYEGFDEDGVDSTKGWVLGTIGAGFYLGNVYGSAICADLYNRRVHHDFVKGLQIEITLP